MGPVVDVNASSCREVGTSWSEHWYCGRVVAHCYCDEPGSGLCLCCVNDDDYDDVGVGLYYCRDGGIDNAGQFLCPDHDVAGRDCSLEIDHVDLDYCYEYEYDDVGGVFHDDRSAPLDL